MNREGPQTTFRFAHRVLLEYLVAEAMVRSNDFDQLSSELIDLIARRRSGNVLQFVLQIARERWENYNELVLFLKERLDGHEQTPDIVDAYSVVVAFNSES